MKREYNEVYGYLPEDIINKLSEIDRQRLFIRWVMQEPTETGWIITKAVINSLGDDFVDYLFASVIASMESNDEMVTKESVINNVSAILDTFATDVNTLYEYVDIYREERLSGDETSESDEEEDQHQDEKPQPKKVLKRDKNGRFIKTEE